MTPILKNSSLVAIDFESSGEAQGESGVPIQIGLVEMKSLQLDPCSFFSSYLKTNTAITKAAKKIHGIASTHLQEAPSLLELWPELQQRLQGRCLVAHGHGTERRFLRAFPMHGFGPWIDTLTLSRQFFPGLPSYALADVIAYCNLTEELYALHPSFRWHEALSDAIASLLLLLHLIKTANLADHPISFVTQKRHEN
jgi:DNA polymerase-3 subunit epsilon